MNIRPAYATDSDTLAYLTNIASEGMAEAIWEHLALAKETPLQAGARLIKTHDGIFSYRNTSVVVNQQRICGLMSGRHLVGSNLPVSLDEFLPFIRPLIKLEQNVQDSWNITALAVDQQYQHQGGIIQLLQTAEQLAVNLGLRKLSFAIASENAVLNEYVEQYGFQEVAHETFVRFGSLKHNGLWRMMVKVI